MQIIITIIINNKFIFNGRINFLEYYKQWSKNELKVKLINLIIWISKSKLINWVFSVQYIKGTRILSWMITIKIVSQ